MAEEIDAEVQAIQGLISALTPLDDESRTRVIDYVVRRFSLTRPLSPAIAPPASRDTDSEATLAPEEAPQVRTGVTDIRTLKEEKSPRSAVEMSVLVAYYLSELAPPDERSETIGTTELTKYFKQADYRLPSTPRVTLHQAKNGGYLDSSSHGHYKLNPVGYNLVAHGLPSATTRKRAAKSSSRKPSKKTTRGSGARKKKPTKARKPRSSN